MQAVRIRSLLLTLILALIIGAMPALAHPGHDTKPPEAKKAILLVSFGTSMPKAQAVFDGVDAAFKNAFPGVEIRWAFTSKTVRRIVAEKQGKTWLSPAEALAALKDQGYNKVIVQSLHVIPGAEFHDLVATVEGFKVMGGCFMVRLGMPLCSTTGDLKAVAAILKKSPPAKLAKGEAVVFMGHGTHHPAGVAYPAMAYILGRGHAPFYMGTVEGYPSLDDVVALLKAAKVKKAYLVPFMTVAGDHATNDMAGDEPDSWKSVINKAGIKTKCVLEPITTNPEIIAIYVGHAKAALQGGHH